MQSAVQLLNLLGSALERIGLSPWTYWAPARGLTRFVSAGGLASALLGQGFLEGVMLGDASEPVYVVYGRCHSLRLLWLLVLSGLLRDPGGAG